MGPQRGSRGKGIGVLVVDDHEVVRRGLLRLLDSEPDIDVVGEAGGGAQALDLLASMESEGRRPDVIVMDLQMAPMNGIESTRQVRALYGDIEVVALTAFAEKERVRAVLEAGALGYVLKDSDGKDVAAAIRAAHRGELQIDPVVARELMASIREAREDDAVSELTSREVDVLRLVAVGKPNKQIAIELVISERTARTHVSRILHKLELSSRTQAALWAVREGLVDVEPEVEHALNHCRTSGPFLGGQPSFWAGGNKVATRSSQAGEGANIDLLEDVPEQARTADHAQT